MVNQSIRRLREQLGLSQAQLAHRAGMTKPQLCVIEKGCYHLRSGTLERIARALGTTVPELMKMVGAPANSSPLTPLFASSARYVAERVRAEKMSERIDERVKALGTLGATTLPFVQSFVREELNGAGGF